MPYYMSAMVVLIEQQGMGHVCADICHLLRPCMKEEEPAFGIFQCFDELVSLEIFLLDAGVILLDPDNSLRTLLERQEFGLEWIVWEEKPDKASEENRHGAGND